MDGFAGWLNKKYFDYESIFLKKIKIVVADIKTVTYNGFDVRKH